MMLRMPGLAAAAAALCLFAMADQARAQSLLLGLSVGAGSGVEGGDVGNGTEFRRARTRLEVAVDGRIDEDRKQALEVRAFAEIEPHMTLGGGFRYLFTVSPRLQLGGGVVFGLFPHSLLGVDVAAPFRVPFPSKSVNIFVEPSFAVLPLGTDLPGDTIIMWGLIKLGIHADLF